MSEFRDRMELLADELDEQADRYHELSRRSRRPVDRCEGKAFGLRRASGRIRSLLARPDLDEDDVAMSWHNRFHAEFMAHAELRDDLSTLDEPSDVPDGNGRCTSELADALFNAWAEMPETTGDYAAGEQLAAAAMTVIRRALDRHPKPNP